jgi:hypothetical protein
VDGVATLIGDTPPPEKLAMPRQEKQVAEQPIVVQLSRPIALTLASKTPGLRHADQCLARGVRAAVTPLERCSTCLRPGCFAQRSRHRLRPRVNRLLVDGKRKSSVNSREPRDSSSSDARGRSHPAVLMRMLRDGVMP